MRVGDICGVKYDDRLWLVTRHVSADCFYLREIRRRDSPKKPLSTRSTPDRRREYVTAFTCEPLLKEVIDYARLQVALTLDADVASRRTSASFVGLKLFDHDDYLPLIVTSVNVDGWLDSSFDVDVRVKSGGELYVLEFMTSPITSIDTLLASTQKHL